MKQCVEQLRFSDVKILIFLRQMQSYSIFAQTSVKWCVPQARISLPQFPVLWFSQFLAMRDSIDVYYYLFHGKQISHQGESTQMVVGSLRMQEVLGLITRFVLKNISRREAIDIYIVYDIEPQITLQLG